MKKRLGILVLALAALLITGCGGKRGDVAGKTFVYEKEGFLGDFGIKISDDGTFSWYEGFASSYIGFGEWTVEGDLLILKDAMFVNVFEIGDGKLIWRAEGSDNFLHVKVSDGEAFLEKTDK